MKKVEKLNLKKINLKNLSMINTLNHKEKSMIIGGNMDCDSCGCACAYADRGGSSINANGHANMDGCLNSPGCECE